MVVYAKVENLFEGMKMQLFYFVILSKAKNDKRQKGRYQ